MDAMRGTDAELPPQLLSMVTHELRAPLNSIQCWTLVLEHHLRQRTPDVERALAGIRAGIEQQVRLIEDLLENRSPPPEAAGASLPALDGLRVMVVDDQPEAREAIAALLTRAGAQVCSADGGRSAVTQLQALAAEDRPHVFLCDIAMPEEDGYQTLRRVREWEQQAHAPGAIPAVALTSFSMREDRIRALAAGYTMHLSKPVAPAELIMVVATVARER
jgi:CheY-like chemotaxis protein